jgi:hypothetical protein
MIFIDAKSRRKVFFGYAMDVVLNLKFTRSMVYSLTESCQDLPIFLLYKRINPGHLLSIKTALLVTLRFFSIIFLCKLKNKNIVNILVGFTKSL